MHEKQHLTTGEIASELGVPGWLVRRAVDELGEEIPRAGLYRFVPRSLLPRLHEIIEQHKRRNGWPLSQGEAAHAK
jgi:hypothetical protein